MYASSEIGSRLDETMSELSSGGSYTYVVDGVEKMDLNDSIGGEEKKSKKSKRKDGKRDQ
jgi:hypothetical protein